MTRPITQTGEAEIRAVTVNEIMPVRHAVLRPGRSLETARYANDDEPTAHHLGAYRGGKLLGVVSLYIAEMPRHPGLPAIQLRGLATLPEARGTGLGKSLAGASLEFARKQKARILWCNARVSASEFYRKLGFEIVGEEFEIPQIGPHFLMMVTLEPNHPA